MLKSPPEGDDAHLSASPALTVSSSPGADGGDGTVVCAPRYVPLLRTLYGLRRRFPSVLECVSLECTRCHQWVSEEVHATVPDEVPDAVVAEVWRENVPSSSSTGPANPQGRRRRVGDATATAAEATHEAPKWHSQRLREKTEEAKKQQQQRDAACATLASTSEKALLASLRGHKEGNGVASPKTPTQGAQRQYWMPNPVNFVCRWSYCAMGDRIADLRRVWTGEVLKAAEALAEAHHDRTAQHTSEPQPAIGEEEGEREEKAPEPAKDKGSASKATPQGTAGSPMVSTGESAPAALTPPVSLPDLKQRRDALNEALEKELGLRRSSRLASRRGETNQPDRVITTSALLGLLNPQTVVGRESGAVVGPSVASPSPPPPSEATARRQLWLHHAWVQSAASYLVRTDRAASLSAFCWVVCDACGKVRRVAQPFPGGAPFVCGLSVFSGGSCEVSEMAGLVASTQALMSEQVAQAAQLSPFVDLVPPYRVTGDAIDEPILCGVRAVIEAEAESPARGGTNALIARSLPLLRDLAAAIRKRATGSWAKQLSMTPVDVRRKRENVLRQVFLHADEKVAAHTPAPAASRGGRRVKTHTAVEESPVNGKTAAASAQAPARVTATASKRKKSDRKRGRSAETADVVEAPSSVKADDVPVESAAPPSSEPVKRRARKSKIEAEPTTAAAPAPLASAPGEADEATPPPAPVKRPRGRPPKSRPAHPVKRAAAQGTKRGGKSAEEEEEEEIIHWVQCDQCGKWRVIPQPISDTVDFWTCSMRVDPVTGHHTSCSEEDDEKRMAREGVEVREV